VNGYTTPPAHPAYNQGLSVRRATAVQAELVKNGMPQNAITIQGFGDTHLLVPTGPGVREPQNRRVEIVIRWVIETRSCQGGTRSGRLSLEQDARVSWRRLGNDRR
jgi:hypothetical protein